MAEPTNSYEYALYRQIMVKQRRKAAKAYNSGNVKEYIREATKLTKMREYLANNFIEPEQRSM